MDGIAGEEEEGADERSDVISLQAC